MTTMAADVTIPGSRSISNTIARRAVAERDARYDGRFVYAVHSTGVYCRPSCPSRRPTRSALTIYAHSVDAQRAGYRACRRCKPDGLHDDSVANAVARARDYLDTHGPQRIVTLAELAKAARVSAFHLQRSFKRLVGVSPREYQEALRAERLRQELRSGHTVSRATFSAGYGSSSRVYERAHRVLGMTPASYRRGGAGTTVAFVIDDAPAGRVLVATTERGVCAVALGANDSQLEGRLRASFPNAVIVEANTKQRRWIGSVLRRVRRPGALTPTSIPIDVDATAFQRLVWKELQRIPVGQRRSYRDIATAIGRPSATRAVARACASNQIAVVIPCHRVVRTDGQMGGYRWGIERKKALLSAEERTVGGGAGSLDD